MLTSHVASLPRGSYDDHVWKMYLVSAISFLYFSLLTENQVVAFVVVLFTFCD